MVSTKSILVCNPRPKKNPCIPCLNPSKKKSKKRRKNSSTTHHELVGKAQVLLERLKSHPINDPEDRDYIYLQLYRALNKINRLS